MYINSKRSSCLQSARIKDLVYTIYNQLLQAFSTVEIQPQSLGLYHKHITNQTIFPSPVQPFLTEPQGKQRASKSPLVS